MPRTKKIKSKPKEIEIKLSPDDILRNMKLLSSKRKSK